MGSRYSIEAVFTAVDAATAGIDKIQKRMLGMTASTTAGLRSIDEMNGRIHAGFKSLALGAAAAATAAGAIGHNVIAKGSEFEQAITNVGAVSLMSRKQVAELEAEARRLGTTTKYSATEVAGGMELMGKAGFTNSQILADIGPMLSAAAAEGAEFEQVASVISNTLNGMGLEKTAKDTQMVADVLTLASARTNSSITSLGESMKNLAPVARQFKIPFKDAAASVALLQDVGIDASEAGTSMATMLTKLAKPTDDIKYKMQAMGVTFQDAKGNMLALPKVFENFAKAAAKSGGNMKQAAFFADLVGLRGQRAALNMQEMFKSGRFAELAKELENAHGKAKEMADLRMDTFGGDLTKLGNAVDDLKISLFDMNSGPLRDVVQQTTAWITANKGLILTKVQDFISSVVEHLPEIVLWTKRIAVGVGAFYAYATAVKAVKLVFEGYEIAVTAVTTATKLWRVDSIAARFAVRESAVAMRLFNAEAAAGQAGLAGLRTGLNASALGKSINGVTSLLGKAGLLGAAAGVGVAFGLWLNDTFELDKTISGLVAKMTGLDEKLAGRSDSKRGIDANADQVFADKTVISAKGELLAKGKDWESHWAAKAPEWEKKLVAQEQAQRASEDPWMRPVTRQVIGPEAMIARSITETSNTTTSKAEVTIKDETGRAEITKRPRGRAAPRITLQPTGAF